jgi:disease resistance protein RPM1
LRERARKRVMEALGLGKLLEKLGSILLSEALLIGSVRKDIRFIRDELQSMDAAVMDLIRSGMLNHQNKVWMLHVLQVACDAELCIDEFADYLGGHCGCGVIGAARRAARFVSTIAPRYRIAKIIQVYYLCHTYVNLVYMSA